MDNAVPVESPSTTSAPVRLRAVPVERTQPDLIAPAALGNLLRPLTSLIGREADVAAAHAMLLEDSVRLLTLTGPGGVGKTRLALHVADEVGTTFADGVAFVELAPVRDPAHVLAAVADAVGVQDLGLRPLRETLASALGERDLLLVLDNFEHVLSAAPSIADLLRHCPRLRVLASSRAPLAVAGERLWPLAPLPLPPEGHLGPDYGPAVALFVERAQAVAPEHRLSEANAAAVAQICRHLDGLPLAIELAAAWMRIMSLSMLLERLEEHLPLLRGGAKDLPLRFRTMHDAIAWSHDLLLPAEARLFRCLGVFVGCFTLDAVEAVAPADVSDPLTTLRALVDHSLVTSRGGVDGSSRFGMLETIREEALERLSASGDEGPDRDAHAAYFLAFAERHAPDPFRDDDVVQRVEALAAEHASLLAALDHLTATEASEACVRLEAALGQFWFLRSLHSVGRTYLERALARPTAFPAKEAVALASLGQLAIFQGDFAAAAATLVRAEERATVSGDLLALAFVRCRQAILMVVQGNYATAQALAAEAEQLACADDDPLAATFARFLRARAIHYSGDLERAETLFRELLIDPPPPRYADATYRYSLAMIALTRRMDAEALSVYVAALPHFLAIGEQWSVATCLEGVATALASLGRAEAAARLFGSADALRSRIGAPMRTPDESTEYDRGVASALAALGSEVCAKAWDGGGALTADAAVAEAQAEAALALAASEPDTQISAPPCGLTRRQQEILRHMVAGHSDRLIAEALYISHRTVSHHVAAIMAKLDVRTRGEAAVRAVRDGVI